MSDHSIDVANTIYFLWIVAIPLVIFLLIAVVTTIKDLFTRHDDPDEFHDPFPPE